MPPLAIAIGFPCRRTSRCCLKARRLSEEDTQSHTHPRVDPRARAHACSHTHRKHFQPRQLMNTNCRVLQLLILLSSSSAPLQPPAFPLVVLANRRRLAPVRTSVCSTGNTSLCCKVAQTTAISQSRRTRNAKRTKEESELLTSRGQ